MQYFTFLMVFFLFREYLNIADDKNNIPKLLVCITYSVNYNFKVSCKKSYSVVHLNYVIAAYDCKAWAVNIKDNRRFSL